MTIHARQLGLALLASLLVGMVPSLGHVSPASSRADPWVTLPWDDAVGRVLGSEADSEGPQSFALEPDGGVLVLDQVNQRVLELDATGALTRAIPLPARTFEDVEQVDGRALLLLDRLIGKRLVVMSFEGSELAAVPLEGRGVERAGLVTALLPRADGVWLEVGHRHSVKVLDRDLRPCERQVARGRPFGQGQSLRASLDGRGGVVVSTGGRTDRQPARTVTLTGRAPVERIVWADVDPAGRVHVVLHEAERAASSPFRVTSEQYRLVTLDAELRELERTEIPWVLTELSQHVEFRLGSDGRPWQMAYTPEGVALLAWGRRAP